MKSDFYLSPQQAKDKKKRYDIGQKKQEQELGPVAKHHR